MIIVQPAIAVDGQIIQQITFAIREFSPHDQECVQELWADYLEKGLGSSYRFCISRDQHTHQVIGYACYGKHALTESSYDLYWIAVDPQYRRSGAGSCLLKFVEDRVCKLQGTRIFIETSSTEPYQIARNFYRRHHYTKEAVLRDFYGPGDHLVIFSKYLNSNYETNESCSSSQIPDDDPDLKIRWGEKRYC